MLVQAGHRHNVLLIYQMITMYTNHNPLKTFFATPTAAHSVAC